MTKSKAIALARQHIHMSPFSHGYILTQPHNWDELDGPVYESIPSDFWKVRHWLTRTRAEFALHLMGYRNREVDNDGGTLLDLVNQYLRRAA